MQCAIIISDHVKVQAQKLSEKTRYIYGAAHFYITIELSQKTDISLCEPLEINVDDLRGLFHFAVDYMAIDSVSVHAGGMSNDAF